MSYARTLRGMTAQDAANAVMPMGTVRSTPGFTQAVYNDIVQAAQQGNFSAFNPSGCSGITPSGARIVSTVGGLSLTGLSLGLSLGTSIGAAATAGITAGASLLVGLFVSIYAHHAAKVRQEQQIVCASVPAAADSLTAIDQAVQNGTITPAQGMQALQSLQANFESTVAPIIKNDSSHCNAACVWVKELEAIVLKKSSDYQDMEAAQQAAALPPASSFSGAPAQLTVPNPAAAASGGPLPVPTQIASRIASQTTPGSVATLVPPTSLSAIQEDIGAMPWWGWLALVVGGAIVWREI